MERLTAPEMRPDEPDHLLAHDRAKRAHAGLAAERLGKYRRLLNRLPHIFSQPVRKLMSFLTVYDQLFGTSSYCFLNDGTFTSLVSWKKLQKKLKMIWCTY